MQNESLKKILAPLGVRKWQHFKSIGSTNDEALAWVDEDAPDFSLVIAEEQTRGRGRLDRRWVSKAGACLAFSLVLRPLTGEHCNLALYAPLCGIAVRDALFDLFNLDLRIKWPNDVLISQRKCCGILVEAVWTGEKLKGLVLGIGINLTRDSLPPASDNLFPAACLEEFVRQKIDGEEVLGIVLHQIAKWRPLIGTPLFFKHWSENLAFIGEEVMIVKSEKTSIIGIEKGIDMDGNLVLLTTDGEEIAFPTGDLHLRPLKK